MRLMALKCPACGAPLDGAAKGRVVVCAYCDTRIVLDDNLAASSGVLDGDATTSRDDDRSMAEYARVACEEFLRTYGSKHFKQTGEVIVGLGIDDVEEEIYLIHDDTIFKSGKNGFAITDYGLYCRDLGDDAPTYMSWDDFADLPDVRIDGSYIRGGTTCLVYYTDGDEMVENLRNLYADLQKYARKPEAGVTKVG